MIRIGHGYDVHRLAQNRKLIIGGVEIPHDKGLDGHSDADVLVLANGLTSGMDADTAAEYCGRYPYLNKMMEPVESNPGL